MKLRRFKKHKDEERRLAQRSHPAELAKLRSSSPTSMYYRPLQKQPSTTTSIVNKSRPNIKQKPAKRDVSLVPRADVRRLPSIIILIVLAVLIFFASTLSGNVVVQTGADGYQYRSVDEYQQQASELLNSSGLSRSKLLFRSDRYEQDVLELFPELESATALLPLGGRDLSLQIRTSQPLARIQSTGGRAKIINTTGALIELPQHSSDTQGLPQIILDTDYAASLNPGDQVLTQAEVELVGIVIREFTTDSITSAEVQGIERITVSIANGEVLVYLRGVPYYVKFSSYNRIDQQVGAALASLLDLARQGQPPLEYLDARIPGRVFVK